MNAHTTTPARILPTTDATTDREINVPLWVAIPVTLAVWAGIFFGGYAVGHGQARTITVDQTYTGQQIAQCIASGVCHH